CGAYRRGKSGPCRWWQHRGLGRGLCLPGRKGHGAVRFHSILLGKIVSGFFRDDQLRPVVAVEEKQLAGGFLRWLPAGHQQVVEQVEAVVGQVAQGKCDEKSCPVHGSAFLRVSWICSGSQGCCSMKRCRANTMKRFMSMPFASFIRLSRCMVRLSTRMRLFSVPSSLKPSMARKNASAFPLSAEGFLGGFFGFEREANVFSCSPLPFSPLRSFSRSWSASDLISFIWPPYSYA